MQVRKQFPFAAFEPVWQKYWQDQSTFRAANPGEPGSEKPKFYALDMFPYPSGAGLHVGHPEGYTATDIVSRYKRMKGFNVLHPMGWDAFGLPAEQYAVQTGTHPRETTAKNIETFRRQIEALGFSYDWSREVNTTDPAYFKWTQWIFIQLYKKGLAYVSYAPVWYCPALGTTLANEEVIPTPEGPRSDRGNHPVERRPLRQWMLKITAYAERLLNDLEMLDWPDSLKEMQRNWIGRSEGAEVVFQVVDETDTITVFTTRPDTLFGATYMVLSPEHPLVEKLTTSNQRDAVAKYKAEVANKSDLERTELAKSKTGVFTGAFATNPVNSEAIPIWIADYVLMSYGTGAIMAVSAHDERDHEFAVRSIRSSHHRSGRVASSLPPDCAKRPTPLQDRSRVKAMPKNSDFLNGLPTAEAKAKMIDWLEEKEARYATRAVQAARLAYSRGSVIGASRFRWSGRAITHEVISESELPLTLA